VGGGFGQIEAEEGVGEGDGEAGEDAHVDLGLAGQEEAAQLLGALAHLSARAALQRGDERGQIILVRGDEAGQTVGGQRFGGGCGREQVWTCSHDRGSPDDLIPLANSPTG